MEPHLTNYLTMSIVKMTQGVELLLILQPDLVLRATNDVKWLVLIRSRLRIILVTLTSGKLNSLALSH